MNINRWFYRICLLLIFGSIGFGFINNDFKIIGFLFYFLAFFSLFVFRN
tara:strand:+ start:88 stop:234 length:147 start_codon:yes stop_codon:yes gene_type:complete